ncbi:MAG: bifunctional UDP-N-acetylmuramoyl-tripeptide:D-alanyl-D-alanine ligase/alanine racemase [Flavobacteriales bacterium]|nr:bifunctional UDP-N-acetylmuramoyl-tripeptide:D-alanyl-D-alanine ligase/alanine racemase [Flavobacteriales bacterium]
MQYSLATISKIVNAKLIGDGNVIIENVLTDSRAKTNHLACLFAAIRGNQHDGHHYIQLQQSKGFSNFLVEEIPLEINLLNCNFLIVGNVLNALQKLARHHRQNFTFPVVGIAGSNGKTIVKEWSYQLLYPQQNIVRSPRSYNSQIGVPLSVFQMQTTNQLGVFEAGISEPGEMAKLEEILQPTIGIFTNIGDAHAAGFINETEKIYEKLILFKNCKTLIYRREENILTEIIDRFVKENNIESITWSTNSKALISVNYFESKNNQLEVFAEVGTQKYSFELPFSDEASFENALHAWVLTYALKADQRQVIPQFQQLHAVEMRLNQKAGKNNCILISDYYNSDIKSIEIVLNWAENRHSNAQKTVILSDVEQSSLSNRDLFTAINQLLKKHNFSRLIGVGKNISACSFLFDLKEQTFYASTNDLMENFSSFTFENEAIVLKAARSFKFEKIEKLLQQKVHNTVLEVNLNALQNNLNYFKSIIDPKTKIMAMVKAFSYGSGGDEIAHFFQFNQVDYLGVAYADEGIELRKKGIHIPIMVMNSDEDSFDTMLDYKLEPEIYSFRSLDLFEQSLDRKGIETAKVHIEINSGMHRLGFDENEITLLCKRLKQNSNIEIASIFSHLAAAEDKTMDSFTKNQIAIFNRCYYSLAEAIGYTPVKHIANSAGAIRHKYAQFDMIRLGVALYGFSPSTQSDKKIEPISTLKSFISQIRIIKPHEGIGYGNLQPAPYQRKIAVVAIGYADGLNRLLSRGNGYFMINGQEAPIVGNVCMDMTMCDVSEITCEEGDEVIVFGKKPTITELANKIGTIPYEILTSVSQRVKRVYSEE